ncbi:MAG: excisionase [Bacilli bacterium]|nr:excisionase [Bacilli bacterium]
MDRSTLERIAKLTRQIAELPKGYISKKTIHGKVYYYHQWSEMGKTKSVFVPESELESLTEQIALRKRLKDELNDLKWHGASPKTETSKLGYLLMHLDTPVVELSFEERTGVITEVGEAINVDFLPIGTATSYRKVDAPKLKDWWGWRSIPASRSGIKGVLDALNLPTTTALLRKGYGLSLSDCYWAKPINSDLAWKDVNFFDNEFSEDLGELLFAGAKKGTLNLSSPDATSVGNLKKRWKITNGERVLLKGGSAPFRQEPFNEVLASRFCEVLGLEHVPYRLLFIDGYPYCSCPDFVNGHTEFVPAQAILSAYPKEQNESLHSQLLRACSSLGIPNVEPSLSSMIILDFLIANEDRHTNNFGFVRNADTLEWIGMAPLFDNGSSFGFDKLTSEISANQGIVCKPFENKHREQLKLALPNPSIDLKTLDVLPGIAQRFFEEHGGQFVDKERASAICQSLSLRIITLKNLSKKKA